MGLDGTVSNDRLYARFNRQKHQCKKMNGFSIWMGCVAWPY